MQKYHLKKIKYTVAKVGNLQANSCQKLTAVFYVVTWLSYSYFGSNFDYLDVSEVRVNSPPQWLSGQQAQWQVKALTCYCRTYSAEAADM